MHSGTSFPDNIVPRIRALWNNIPTQLSKENKKFIYGYYNVIPKTQKKLTFLE